MIGLNINGSIVYLYPDPGNGYHESSSSTANVTRLLQNSLGEKKVYAYAFPDNTNHGNNYESCYKVTIGGQLRYYAPGASIYTSAQDVLLDIVDATKMYWIYNSNEFWPNTGSAYRNWSENPPPAN